MSSEPTRYRLRVARDPFKFSCAHMTVFPDGRKERLHGHNYTVAVALDLADIAFERLLDLGAVKAVVIELCRDLRERTLVAAQNRYLEVVRDDGADRPDGEIEFRLCGRRYLLPREDVLLLPIDNVSVEALAAHIARLLSERLAAAIGDAPVLGLEVSVDESPGQGATVYLPR